MTVNGKIDSKFIKKLGPIRLHFLRVLIRGSRVIAGSENIMVKQRYFPYRVREGSDRFLHEISVYLDALDIGVEAYIQRVTVTEVIVAAGAHIQSVAFVHGQLIVIGPVVTNGH